MSERTVYLNKGLYVYRESPEMPSATWMQDWMMTLVYAMEERLAIVASHGFPLEKIYGYLPSDARGLFEKM